MDSHFTRKTSILVHLLFTNLLISGCIASFSHGRSRFSEFHGCNDSNSVVLTPSTLIQKESNGDPSPSNSTETSNQVSSSTNYPPNNYFQPVILSQQRLDYLPPATQGGYGFGSPSYAHGNGNDSPGVGNGMSVISFGNNRFTGNGNGLAGGGEMKEDRVPTLRPSTSRLAQFHQNMASYRNEIMGNRFFEMDGSVAFFLYTRKNPSTGQRIQLHNRDLIESSDFKEGKPTKLIIHGFSEIGALGEWVNNLKDAYLSTSEANVIIADFSSFETFLLFWTNLPIFASKRIADMITFLELTKGASRENFHIIARSWGTHVAGVTGRLLQGRVGRITGLEPEARVYGSVLPDYKLVSSDAKFVDIVHVNGRRFFFYGSRFGLSPPSGHVDIYPNFSERSNGCPGRAANYGRNNFAYCQRGRGVSYFTDSIKYPKSHQICRCRSYNDYKNGLCTCSNENSNYFLGEYIDNQTKGVFQLAQSSSNPSWNRFLRMFNF